MLISLPIALSSSQTLTLTVVLLVLAGAAIVGFAFFAFERQKQTRAELETAISTMTNAVQRSVQPQNSEEAQTLDAQQAALMGASDYLRALSELADKLASLSPPVAALVVATIPLFLAAALVGIDLLS